jgi:hypothetical protein
VVAGVGAAMLGSDKVGWLLLACHVLGAAVNGARSP